MGLTLIAFWCIIQGQEFFDNRISNWYISCHNHLYIYREDVMKMVKIALAVLLLAVGTGTAFANGGRHGGGHHHHGGGWGRVIVSGIVGGSIGYGISRAVEVYGASVYAPPMVYTPPCQYIRQQAFDQYGRPLFDQYGQPITQTTQICPAPALRY